MKKIDKLTFTGYLILIIFIWGCSEEANYPDSTLPGLTPIKFSDGVISKNGSFAFCPAMTPDGSIFYYTTRISDSDENRIMETRNENGKWTTPTKASFAQDAYELAPAISPDGKRLYFASERTAPNKKGVNIWKAEKKGNKWTEPKCMEGTINFQFNMNLSEVASGTLYMTSVGGIHKSEKQNGEYTLPAILPETINGLDQAENAYIAPDESFIIFNAQTIVNYVRRTDLFISFKNNDEKWNKAIKMDETINNPDFQQMAPYVSPDGKFLFFTRYKGEQGDIYWVDAKILEKYK